MLVVSVLDGMKNWKKKVLSPDQISGKASKNCCLTFLYGGMQALAKQLRI